MKKTNVDGIGWFASLPDALAEAKRTDKPILLLSMFGRLDEEMPCANARKGIRPTVVFPTVKHPISGLFIWLSLVNCNIF